MTYARFEQEGSVSFGIVDKGVVREIRGAPWETAAGAAMETGRSFPLPKVRLLPPCAPSKIFALAFNYVDHLHGRQSPAEPQIFLKVPSATIGPEETIVLPPHAGEELPGGPGRVDEEGELVVVMGSRCRGVSRAQAMRHVFGYTCGNDVSARAWQKNDLNWWRAKSSDTFAAFGPFIATSIVPEDVLIVSRINGKEVQRCSPRDLIFDIPSLIEWISRSVTLEPGDLIYTGTSGSPAPLQGGDVVEVEIAGIGVLRNPVRQG